MNHQYFKVPRGSIPLEYGDLHTLSFPLFFSGFNYKNLKIKIKIGGWLCLLVQQLYSQVNRKRIIV